MVSYKPNAEYLNYKVVGLNPCCSGRWSSTVIVACTYFFTRRKAKPTEQEPDVSTQPEASADIQQEEKQDEPPHTKDLCIELLKQLNCEVTT